MAKKMKSKRTKYDVSPQDFVVAWQTSETAQEVANKLGMPKPIVLARASSYRSEGIPLKKLRRDSRRALNVPGLKEIIKELAAGRDPEEVRAEFDSDGRRRTSSRRSRRELEQGTR